MHQALATLIFWPAFTALIPQALWVRRTAPRFSGAPGPRSGSAVPESKAAQSAGEALRMVGLGDSIIDGVGCRSLEHALIGATAAALARHLNRRVDWQAWGRSGLNTCDIRKRLLPGTDLEGADVVLISTGVNDVTRPTAIATFRQELLKLLGEVRQKAPGARIAINGLPPMQLFPALPAPLKQVLGLRARQLDHAMTEVVGRCDQVVRVPIAFDLIPERFAADGYHPCERSCAELAEYIAETLALIGVLKNWQTGQSSLSPKSSKH